MFILTEHTGAIGTLTFNQLAKRNALSEVLVEELIKALADFQQAGMRAVVLRAARDAHVWSSGHDISELPQGQDPLPYSDPFERALRAVKTFPAPVIAMLYKLRWRVELFFKWIKQNLRIKHFLGTSDNAVKTQVWIAVCVYVLVAIIRKELGLEVSLAQMLQILSVSVFEQVPLVALFAKPASQSETANSCNQMMLWN